MKWISVEDRLPEIEGYGESYNVIICYETTKNGNQIITEGLYYYPLKTWHRKDMLEVNVTHWMTLPEPPKK